MHPEPLVSIAIPAYNHGAYLAECVDSLLSQDYPRVEVVVVDDGSTDDTPEVLAGFGDRILTEQQSNAGQSAALTRAWSRCSGEILGYVSADDALLPGAVRAAVEAFDSGSDVAFVYGDFELFNEQSETMQLVRSPEVDLVTMLRQFVTVAGPGGFFTRWAYQRAGTWDLRLKQNPDSDFLFRLGLAGRFVHTRRVMARFRVHAGSQTAQRPDSDRADEPIAIANRFFAREDLPPDIRACETASKSAAHVMSARHHLRGRRWSSFMRRAWQAASMHPPTVLSARTARVWAGALR